MSIRTDDIIDAVHLVDPKDRPGAYFLFNAKTFSEVMMLTDYDGVLITKSTDREPCLVLGYDWSIDNKMDDGEIVMKIKKDET